MNKGLAIPPADGATVTAIELTSGPSHAMSHFNGMSCTFTITAIFR
jgi:hypothetical protein